MNATFGEPVYARVRRRLVDDIVAGQFPAGAHLTLAGLTARYGVSHVPIREALAQLAGEGVVELRSHRGAVVPRFDAIFLNRHYDIRGAVQALLTRRCAERAGPREVASLRALHADYAAATSARDVGEVVRLNRAFHDAIYRTAENPLATDLADGRSGLRAAVFDGVRRRLGFSAGALDRFVLDHAEIIERIAARDASGAHDLAWDHMMRAKADLLARLDAEEARAA